MFDVPSLYSFAVTEDHVVGSSSSGSGSEPEVMGSPYLFGRPADWRPRSLSFSWDKWHALVIVARHAYDADENPQ